jgi:hypothetical protein
VYARLSAGPVCADIAVPKKTSAYFGIRRRREVPRCGSPEMTVHGVCEGLRD